MKDPVIYHIAEKIDWQRAQSSKSYSAPSLDSEGFIHFSTAEQIQPTYDSHFSGKTGVILLEVDAQAIGECLKYEFVESRGEHFYHLYSPLHLGTILDTYEVTEGFISKFTARFK
ncbi:MAG: DUF952 domain-containing protein [Bdellovibrionales bacterium]